MSGSGGHAGALHSHALPAYAGDYFPAGHGGASTARSELEECDPETGLTLWTATRLATLQAKLQQRLGPEYLSQRPGPGGGPKLTYLEGWKAIDLANEIFGFNGWSTSVVSLDVDYLDVHPETGKCQCGVSAIVRITLRDGTYHEDVGYGHAEGARGKHAALEKCKKEAITDSIKRGLKTFGRLLGNCLYDRQYARDVLRMPVPNVPLRSDDLHRHADVVAHMGTKRPRPEARAPPTRAAPPARAPPAPKPAPIDDEAELWCQDDPEAATMALELELEEDLILRESQLAQELDE
ncbi:DNA repair protein rad52 [Malassezia caprae]|uniref:DNA repair protein rad52 n=1 Tax=Malassezia caprae TaxID=1381934 RepID=A0AAF0E4X9_9BASI|nr:DNA repair protein rad52 [Malassezia caprae]